MKKEVRADVIEALKPRKVNWSNKQTLLNLSESLSVSETVTGVEFARHNKNDGYLALTNKRLVFAGLSTSFALAALRVSIPILTITSIDVRGRFLRSLYVSTAGQTHEFTALSAEFATRIMNTPIGAEAQMRQSADSPVDKLLKLKQLLNAGVLTQEEYDVKTEGLKQLL